MSVRFVCARCRHPIAMDAPQCPYCDPEEPESMWPLLDARKVAVLVSFTLACWAIIGGVVWSMW